MMRYVQKVPRFNKWVENEFRRSLSINDRKMIFEIIDFVGQRKFVDRDMIFKNTPGIGLSILKKCCERIYLVEYYSLENDKYFYTLDVDGYYLLERSSRFYTELALNSFTAELEQIYFENCLTFYEDPFRGHSLKDLEVIRQGDTYQQGEIQRRQEERKRIKLVKR